MGQIFNPLSSTGESFVSPTITGTVSGSANYIAGTVAIGGASLGGNALAVTGNTAGTAFNATALGSTSAVAFGFNSAKTGFYSSSQDAQIVAVVNGTVVGTWFNNELFMSQPINLNANYLQLNGTGSVISTPSAAVIHFGIADNTSPIAQTLGVQGVVAGTSNTAGANWTINGSVGTGTGAGGQIILQTAPAGSTGSAQNSLAAAITLTAPAVNMQPSVVVGNQALSTSATDGFLYIPTCAGTPTGTPTGFTGRIAMVYDTTNHQFWFYDTAWKQPKTPAGAATVTWQ